MRRKENFAQLWWNSNGTSESLTMSTNTFFIWLYFVTRTYLFHSRTPLVLCLSLFLSFSFIPMPILRVYSGVMFEMMHHFEWHCYRSRNWLKSIRLDSMAVFLRYEFVQFVLSVFMYVGSCFFHPIFAHIFLLFGLLCALSDISHRALSHPPLFLFTQLCLLLLTLFGSLFFSLSLLCCFFSVVYVVCCSYCSSILNVCVLWATSDYL